jgi:catechol 2,3-dioxygenase-like lactoylglutathione lyase family enzyme
VNWTLEVVVVPVADADRAKDFYADRLGFHVDVDRQVTDDFRVVQLTPRGSGCSITLLTGGGARMEPGSLKGLQLCVKDIRAAHAHLVERGVEASDVQVFEGGGPRPARIDDELDYAGFVFFEDPDGNAWAVQQMPGRE